MSHLSRRLGFFLVVVFAVVLLLTQAAVTTAATVQIESARDNTLIQSSSGSRSLGEGDIFVGLNDDQNRIRRGLVAFDVSNNVPAGATIDSVMLRMYVDKTRVGNRAVSLHRVRV